MSGPRCCFVVESGTDVRLVEGLAEQFDLSILARRIVGGVEISHPPGARVPTVIGPAGRLQFARLVWQRLRQRRAQPNAVIVQGYSLAALAANAAARLTGVPTFMLVCSPTESYYRCREKYADDAKPYRYRELLALQVLARVNAVVGGRYIALSDHLANVVRGHGARGRVAVIPIYGVDTSLFSPSSEPKAVLRARLELPTTGSLIFFSSRVAPEKDSGTLLAAVRQLVDAGRELWVLHRSGGYTAFVRHAERYGVAERVVAGDALHPHAQLPSYYQASDLCVQASREEGLGFSPLEALACEIPVVATAVGGLRETIVDGETGWTYPVGDVRALARCIDAALGNPAEARRRAVEGRRVVRERYGRSVAFAKLIEEMSAYGLPRAGARHVDRETAAR